MLARGQWFCLEKERRKRNLLKKESGDRHSGSSSEYSFSDSSSGSISVSEKSKKNVKSGIHAKSSDSVQDHQ